MNYAIIIAEGAFSRCRCFLNLQVHIVRYHCHTGYCITVVNPSCGWIFLQQLSITCGRWQVTVLGLQVDHPVSALLNTRHDHDGDLCYLGVLGTRGVC
jgi:hypothetical protein